MKDMFFKFFERFIVGEYRVNITDEVDVISPRLFIIFLVAFITTTIGDIKNVDWLRYVGYFLICLGLFSYFYYYIFPNRRPKL